LAHGHMAHGTEDRDSHRGRGVRGEDEEGSARGREGRGLGVHHRDIETQRHSEGEEVVGRWGWVGLGWVGLGWVGVVVAF